MTFRRLLSTGGPVLGLLLILGLIALDAEVRPFFFTAHNGKTILVQTAIVAVGALGMTLIIVSGGIDLSVGSMVALGSVVAARLLSAGWSTTSTVAATMILGGCVGCLNGGIVAGFRMLPFIVTLGTMGVLRGSAKWISGNQTVPNPKESVLGLLLDSVDPDKFFPLPPGVWASLGLAVVIAVLMRRTVFGRYLFAIGSNEAAARLSGVRVAWVKLAVYAVAGVLFGFASLLQNARLSLGDPTAAIGLELDIIAAVVI
ncbi:MAG: ABC transporter permease, partial [Pedosphaera sp.]|nr:ABC transporter permease [Pedosphaera sp.]